MIRTDHRAQTLDAFLRPSQQHKPEATVVIDQPAASMAVDEREEPLEKDEVPEEEREAETASNQGEEQADTTSPQPVQQPVQPGQPDFKVS